MMRSMLLVGVLAAVLAVGALPVGAGTTTPAGPAWTSEWFHSPTHNIHCRWFWNEGLMACMTENNGRMAAVTPYGRPYARWGTGGRTFPAGPTLYYGELWNGYNGSDTQVIRCWSRSTGMTCKSLMTGRGFSIAREGIRLI
jgi:hypothetical protein